MISGIALISACIPTPDTTLDKTPALVPGPDPAQAVATPVPVPEPNPTPRPEPPPDTDAPPIPVKAAVGYRAPDFKMQNPDGTSFSLNDIDKPAIINFWHTRCRPCRNEMPLLEQVHDEMQPELILLAINTGQSPATVTDFLNDNHLKLPVVIDTSGVISNRYLVQYVPTTFFIDADGIIRNKVVGAFPNRAAIDKSMVKIMP